MCVCKFDLLQILSWHITHITTHPYLAYSSYYYTHMLLGILLILPHTLTEHWQYRAGSPAGLCDRDPGQSKELDSKLEFD
jgi:hypothetical protein